MDFDGSLSLEDTYYRAGYEDGTRDGALTGLIEGRIYGSELAFERFLVVGQLHARLDLWRVQHASNPRLFRHIRKVEELFDIMPKDNSETLENEDYESILAAIVAKMKVIASLCGGENLVRQGIILDAQTQGTSRDLEDGAELAVQLRGGQRKACAT